MTSHSEAFLAFVVASLVDNKDAVRIERSLDDRGVLLSVTVDKDDMGKLIGRDGATAKAIRVLLRTVGMKEEARVALKITEPEGSTHTRVGHYQSTQELLGNI